MTKEHLNQIKEAEKYAIVNLHKNAKSEIFVKIRTAILQENLQTTFSGFVHDKPQNVANS